MTLMTECPDIQNISIIADPQPGNLLGSRAVVWTYADPDAKEPAEQKRGLVVADAAQRFLAANSPAARASPLNAYDAASLSSLKPQYHCWGFFSQREPDRPGLISGVFLPSANVCKQFPSLSYMPR